ncbi:hypothetical protein BN938_2446 [Mucinivorans hirudinis]|uniref:Uncharacterized protein n=1 Tax=Mucinivorans hirudinis TaxID=1433126 RepID=A0A060RA58_9BACT|nr:hypothetical protein BN938_2446 [Mucinivorans hirudinis]
MYISVYYPVIVKSIANTTTATQMESYSQPSHRLWSSAEPSEIYGY